MNKYADRLLKLPVKETDGYWFDVDFVGGRFSDNGLSQLEHDSLFKSEYVLSTIALFILSQTRKLSQGPLITIAAVAIKPESLVVRLVFT